MFKEASVHQALKQTFPEFNDKIKLIDYYVSFDFPEKQMKMVGWWQKVIQFIIEHQNKVYITYQQLVSYLSIYNLKPTPLQAIINYLSKKEILAPQNEYEVKQANEKENNQNKKSFLGSLFAYVYKPAVKEQSLFKFTGNEKIYSKKIKEYKKQQIKKQLPALFSEHNKSISQFKIIQQLQDKVNLDRDSLCELIRELDRQNAIKLSQNRGHQFVLYSHNSGDLLNKQWIEMERMKFCLREQIYKFQLMIEKEEQKTFKLKQKAKDQMSSNNRKSALSTCKDIKSIQKKIQNIATRKNVLQNQMTQLQYNEMNKTTMALLDQAHSVYKATMIDQNRLDEIAQKSIELQIANKQNNQKMEAMLNKEDNQEEVDEMMRSLEKEIAKKPQKQTVKVQIPMEIEYPNGKIRPKEQAHQKMDIQA